MQTLTQPLTTIHSKVLTSYWHSRHYCINYEEKGLTTTRQQNQKCCYKKNFHVFEKVDAHKVMQVAMC